MRREMLISAITSIFIFGTGYLQAHSHTTYIVESNPVVVVESQPPTDIVEEMGTAPGEGYYWQKGRWCWNGAWAWHKGCWVCRPVGKVEYIPGYWKKNHHHWVWVEPYWK